MLSRCVCTLINSMHRCRRSQEPAHTHTCGFHHSIASGIHWVNSHIFLLMLLDICPVSSLNRLLACVLTVSTSNAGEYILTRALDAAKHTHNICMATCIIQSAICFPAGLVSSSLVTSWQLQKRVILCCMELCSRIAHELFELGRGGVFAVDIHTSQPDVIISWPAGHIRPCRGPLLTHVRSILN